MASVVVKTIWQSKEIHEAGDPPAGVESHSQLVPEAPGGVSTPAKGITKKKKAVSFHGWVCRTHPVGDGPSAQHCLQQSTSATVGAGGRGGGDEEGATEGQARRWWQQREVERKRVVGMERGRVEGGRRKQAAEREEDEESGR